MPSGWWQRYLLLDVTAIGEFFAALAAGREALGPCGGDGSHLPCPGYSRIATAPSRN
jgi:hypothetical protein